MNVTQHEEGWPTEIIALARASYAARHSVRKWLLEHPRLSGNDAAAARQTADIMDAVEPHRFLQEAAAHLVLTNCDPASPEEAQAVCRKLAAAMIAAALATSVKAYRDKHRAAPHSTAQH
jgi:inorganic triphosphatase YgiF